MNKKEIENKLTQILRAANALTVSGESNAAQVLGITRAARDVWQLVNAPEEQEVTENG